MDYSTIQEESPAGASPWANSPQQTTKPTFVTSMAEPQSPQAAQQQQHYPHRNMPPPSGLNQDPEAYNPQQTAPQNGHYDPSDRQAEQAPGESFRQQPNKQQQPPQRTPMPARTPSQRQQSSAPAQRPQPQYKLQAKVNGFERTGRKDPILRFDIHVWIGIIYCYFLFNS